MALMIEVNLLPAEFQVAKNQYAWIGDRRVVYSVLTLIVALAVGWMGWLTLEASLTATQSSISSLQKEIKSYDTVKTQIKALEDFKAKQDAKNQALRSISVSKKRWVRILEDLNASVPPHTWIISIKEEGDDRLALVGRTYVFPEVAQLMMQLERRPFFDVPALDNIEQVAVSNTDKNSTNAFAFTLHCPLKAAIHSDDVPQEKGVAVGH
jgi:type IV pilus assembly protein PilN